MSARSFGKAPGTLTGPRNFNFPQGGIPQGGTHLHSSECDLETPSGSPRRRRHLGACQGENDLDVRSIPDSLIELLGCRAEDVKRSDLFTPQLELVKDYCHHAEASTGCRRLDAYDRWVASGMSAALAR
jgi:hypothetical protein